MSTSNISKPIVFCPQDTKEDERQERKITFWIKILRTVENGPDFLFRNITDFIRRRIEQIDTRYFKQRILAVCPKMGIDRVSSRSAPDRHYYIFKVLVLNKSKLQHQLPTSILELLE